MAKIINIDTGKEKEIPQVPTFECNVCRCNFEEGEGGLHGGMIGMLPVNFCPTCLSGIFDMVSFLKGENEEDNE